MAGVQTDSTGRKYVIVTRNPPTDCLTNIAVEYCSGYDYYKTLATINHISNHNLIIDGQKIYLEPPKSGSSGSGSSSSSSASSSSSSSNRPTILQFGLQNGTARTLYATWAWSRHSDTDHYEVKWEYGTGNGVSFIGSSSPVYERQSTFNIPPEASTTVSFKVKPIAKTENTGNGNSTPKFTADWSTTRTYFVSGLAPSNTWIPDVTIKDGKLTAKVNNVNESGVTQIQFQVVQDDKSVCSTGTSRVVTGTATYTCSVSTGHEYKARCRAVKGLFNYGEWSDYSGNKGTPPATPSGITTLKANSATEVYIAWNAVATAEGYVVEYTTNKAYFDTSDSEVSRVSPSGAAATISNLTSGKEYFFRVKATNGNGESGWTAIKSIIIGEPPGSPTTWSSTTTAIVGEEIVLFWIHNSEDGSKESWADVEVYVNDTLINLPAVQNKDPEDEAYASSLNLQDAMSKVSGAESLLSRDAVVKWRVRTKGVTDEWGDWSILRTIDIYEAPSISLEVTSMEGEGYGEPFGIPSYYRVDITETGDYIATMDAVDVYTKTLLPNVYTDTGEPVYSAMTPSGYETYCYVNKNIENNYVSQLPICVKAVAEPKTQTPLGYHVTVVANEAYETVDFVGNVKMVNKGEEVYSNYFESNASLDGDMHLLIAYLSADNIDLHNNIAYTVTCAVAMDSGLSAEASVSFRVAWSETLYQPNAEIAYDKDTYVTHIRPYCENRTITCNKVTVADGVYTVTDEAYEYIYPDYRTSPGGVFTETGERVYSGATKSGDKIYFCEVENDTTIIYYKVIISNGVYTITDTAYDYIYPDPSTSPGGVFTETGERVYSGATENGEEIYFAEVTNVTPIEGVLLSVYRREFDGSFVEIIKDIDGSLKTFVTDPHPALDYARYRIVAKEGKTGAISYYDMPGYPIGETAAIIQWDEEWSNFDSTSEGTLVDPPWSGSLLKLPYNIDIAPKNSVDVEFVEYIGRKRPVDYYGTQLGETDTWSAAIPKSDKETLYALRRLAIWTGRVYAREPSGSGYWASVSVSAPQKHLDVTVPVTIELTRVEGGM